MKYKLTIQEKLKDLRVENGLSLIIFWDCPRQDSFPH